MTMEERMRAENPPDRPDMGRRRIFLFAEDEAAFDAAQAKGEDGEGAMAEAVETPPPPAEPTPAERILDYVRGQSRLGRLASRAALADEPYGFSDETINEALAALAGESEEGEIVALEGKKDVYLFSARYMAGNYARILFLLSESDNARTLAETVRFECRIYPRPYRVEMLSLEPYFFDDATIQVALRMVEEGEDYGDIKRVYDCEGSLYLYSDALMTYDEAKGLCDYEIEAQRNP